MHFRVRGDSRWVMKALALLKHHRGQKTLHSSGLGESVALMKCHFVRQSQRIMFRVPARFLYQGATL